MKIKNFLTFVFGLFAVAAAIVFAVVSGISLNGEVEKNYVALINEQAAMQSANAELYVKSVMSEFAAIADGVKNAGDKKKFADDYRAGRTDITGIFLAGAETPEELGNIALSDFEDNKLYLYPRDEKPTTDNFGLLAKTDIGGSTLIITYTEDVAKKIVESSVFPVSGRLILLDPKNNAVDEGTMGAVSARSNLGTKTAEYKELEKLTAGGAAVSREFNAARREYTANYQKAGETGWAVITVGNISAAKKAASDSTGVVWIITVIICVAGLVMTFITVRTFTKPLDIISRTILQIRRGDHDARVNVMSRNEYGEVARLFNDLIDDIVVGEARYRTIIEMSDNIIFEWNLRTNDVIFSNNFNKKFSYRAPSDHFTDSFLLKCKVHDEDAARYRQDLENLGKGVEFKHNEYRIKNIYGDWVWFLFRTSSIKDENGEIFKIIGVMVDIDRAKKSEENLSSRASYDALTNVYNRDSIESMIENEIELISVRKDKFAVLFVDIDDFKDFNDKYSHATGDQVLKFTAETLSNAVQGFGMVGRYGGDEFVVCAKNAEVNNPENIAKEILAKLKEGYTADTGDHISINASIGVIIVRDASRRIEMVVGAADDAMYKIKKGGKSNYIIINEE